MASPAAENTIPNARIGLEQLLSVIRGLDEASLERIAEALVSVEMDGRFEDLIEQLAKRACAEDITDADIDDEVDAARGSVRPV